MSWFDEDNGGAPHPVTAERLVSVITDELKFQGNAEEEGKFYCYVNGVPVRFDCSPLPTAYYVNATMFNHTLPAERYDEALDWVSEFNLNTHFVHAYAVRNQEEGAVMVCADTPVLVEEGLTDAQLKGSLEHCLTGLIVFAERFCEAFDLTLDQGES